MPCPSLPSLPLPACRRRWRALCASGWTPHGCPETAAATGSSPSPTTCRGCVRVRVRVWGGGGGVGCVCVWGGGGGGGAGRRAGATSLRGLAAPRGRGAAGRADSGPRAGGLASGAPLLEMRDVAAPSTHEMQSVKKHRPLLSCRPDGDRRAYHRSAVGPGLAGGHLWRVPPRWVGGWVLPGAPECAGAGAGAGACPVSSRTIDLRRSTFAPATAFEPYARGQLASLVQACWGTCFGFPRGNRGSDQLPACHVPPAALRPPCSLAGVRVEPRGGGSAPGPPAWASFVWVSRAAATPGRGGRWASSTSKRGGAGLRAGAGVVVGRLPPPARPPAGRHTHLSTLHPPLHHPVLFTTRSGLERT